MNIFFSSLAAVKQKCGQIVEKAKKSLNSCGRWAPQPHLNPPRSNFALNGLKYNWIIIIGNKNFARFGLNKGLAETKIINSEFGFGQAETET